MSNLGVERELAVQDLENRPIIQDELTWGLSYRDWNVETITSPLKQKVSPINVPFRLCRAAQTPLRKTKKLCRCGQFPESATPQISLLGRSVLTRTKYMDLLATPNQINLTKTKKKKIKVKPCCKCKIEPCPPRLIQMAVPKKRRVLSNWQEYQNVLSAERLMKFDQILKSGNNLEPREARYYFKQLKRKEKKILKKRKKCCKKLKELKKHGDNLWIKCEIKELVKAIVNYVKNEPLLMLNFNQMMTANELLRYLQEQKVVKVKSRNTKSAYKKSIIEISDKLVKWMDAMSFFADIQPVNSKEKILEIPSLEGLLEQEEEIVSEEEEEGGEGEEMGRRLREEQEIEGLLGEEDFLGAQDQEAFMAKKLLDRKEAFLEDEGEGSVYDMLRTLDEDVLQKLIQIFEATPEDVMNEEVDSENLPGVTHLVVLEKLKLIRDSKLQKEGDKIFLEEKMVEWAKHNDPESIDDKVLDKIHETSLILNDWFKSMGDRAGIISGEVTDESKEKTVLPSVEEVVEKADESAPLEAAEPTTVTEEPTEAAMQKEEKPGEVQLESLEEQIEGMEPAAGSPEELAASSPESAAAEATPEAAAADATPEAAVADATPEAAAVEATPEAAVAEGSPEEAETAGGTLQAPETEEGTPEAAVTGEDNLPPGEKPVDDGSPEGVVIESVEEPITPVDAEVPSDLKKEEATLQEAAITDIAKEEEEERVGAPAGEEGAPEGEAEVSGAQAEGVGIPEEKVAPGEEDRAGEEIGGPEGEQIGPEGEQIGPEGEQIGDEAGGKIVAPPGAELGEFIAGGPEEGFEGDYEMGRELTPLEKEIEAMAQEGEELYAEELFEGEEEMGVLPVSAEYEELDRLLGVIKGHKPPYVMEHKPGTICCLSLKIWAVWLLEIANNAHNWTKWMNDITRQIRFYVSVIRGDVTLPNGQKRVLRKEEWRKFSKETEAKVISWRQYSQHVKDLSSEIVENFHGKPVRCCPKCLQDNLIKNVVTAHETFQALTEAINCAGYWQRCLDRILKQTSQISGLELQEDAAADQQSVQSEESYVYVLEEVTESALIRAALEQKSSESVYEIEEVRFAQDTPSVYEIYELSTPKAKPKMFELEEIIIPQPKRDPSQTKTKRTKSKTKKNAK